MYGKDELRAKNEEVKDIEESKKRERKALEKKRDA